MASAAETEPHVPCWWTISETALMDMLRRVSAGADPDMVYMEEYASADIEFHEGEEE